MTIDEAIKHAEEVASRMFDDQVHCIKCAEEHKQLAEWLKDYKRLKERQPYEKFESTKDHIYKLAGDYKCWDNRLTEDEAVELCHILEQQSMSTLVLPDVDKKVESYKELLKHPVVMHIMDETIKYLPPVKPQEPRAVLYSGDGYADGYMVYDMAECPKCGRKFEYGDETWNCNFCPDCGQALNWESEE